MTPNNRPELAAQSPLLRQWLRTATRWLSPEAAERAQREITEHFDATVLVGLEQGKSLAAAEQHALNALGSPLWASWQLRKSNLTTFDAQIISIITGIPDNATKNPQGHTLYAWAFSAFYLVIAVVAGDWSPVTTHDIHRWCCALSMTAIYASRTFGPLLFRFAPSLGVREVLRRVWWLQCCLAAGIAMLTLTPMATIPQAVSKGEFDSAFLHRIEWFYFGLVLFMAGWTSRLIRKLRDQNGPVQS
jgi:hypothetical protein